MNRLEYIPGDLVSVYVGIKKYIVEVIGTENENEVLSYQIKFQNGEIQYADKDNIVQIPLTSEILEKNGWVKDKECSFKTQLYYKKNFGVNIITIIAINEDFRVVYNTTYIRHIQYVHQLQHLLFGLDINPEMEV